MITDFDINSTCCFTGHRVLRKDFDVTVLEQVINEAVNSGYKTFLTGMANGFDRVCASVVMNLKEEKNVEIIACVPCRDQTRFFTSEQKAEYNYFLKNADKVIYLSDGYYKGCMQLRNRYMVDNSSLVIAYSKTNFGGTYYTVSYAVKNNKKIVYV